MGSGRPTKYTPELIKKAQEYVLIYETLGDVIPSVEGLVIYLGIRRSTAYEWAKHEDKKEFSDILDEINVTQKSVLINKGLKGEFNSNICKLALGKHGYTDKVHQELTGEGGGPVEITGIDICFVKPKEVEEDE